MLLVLIGLIIIALFQLEIKIRIDELYEINQLRKGIFEEIEKKLVDKDVAG